MSKFPSLVELNTDDDELMLIYKLEEYVMEYGRRLLEKITEISNVRNVSLQVATSESLTAGLIMSSLVNLPIGGWAKYGCFGVYDTDAKRVFNNVTVDDVYTHTCAKEMAIGLLKNSNATLAISVTGNAMPYFKDLTKLGEVFIGVAGYIKEGDSVKIVYQTRSVNQCLNPTISEMEKIINQKCNEWVKEQPTENDYAPRPMTALISRLIRNYTAITAMDFAVNFLKKLEQNLIVPDFIKESKKINNAVINKKHNNIPQSKYPVRDRLEIICKNKEDECSKHKSQYGKRWGKNEIKIHSGEVYSLPNVVPNIERELKRTESVDYYPSLHPIIKNPILPRSVSVFSGGKTTRHKATRHKERKTRRKRRKTQKKKYNKN